MVCHLLPFAKVGQYDYNSHLDSYISPMHSKSSSPCFEKSVSKIERAREEKN